MDEPTVLKYLRLTYAYPEGDVNDEGKVKPYPKKNKAVFEDLTAQLLIFTIVLAYGY